MAYEAASARYSDMQYRVCGKSGLKLPALSVGLGHNFGDTTPLSTQREILRTAFDLGITHFDLANNYGPPYGSAETNFGRLFKDDFRPYRDELVISTKAGWDMWPGPYGQGGGSRKYLLASLDQSLARMGLDYVDIFYSHRLDGSTPLEETMGALNTAASILKDLGTPLLIHQPSYSMLNRWIEREGLLDAAEDLGIGVIGFTVLAQGLLTGKYLNGIPEGSRATQKDYGGFDSRWINDEVIGRVRELNAIAEKRGQSLPQMALAWSLRDPRMTSLVIGASSAEQLEQNVDALDNVDFSAEELAEIDRIVDFDSGVDEWADARSGKIGAGI